MLNIVLASNNKKKIAELETLFSSVTSNMLKVISLKDIDFNDDIVEDGDSFEENALIKASTPASLGYIGVADDSGLAVDYLNGAPGIFSARYSGEGATDEKNRNKLIHELNGVDADERSAKFVCVAAFVLPENSDYTIPQEWRISEELSAKSGIPSDRAMVVRGECHGLILTEERGEGGFGYDSLFYYPDFEQTFAEIPAEKKHSVSHRGIAMAEFTGKVKEIIENHGVN